MCIVEERSYIRPDGRQEVRTVARRCHHASGSKLCEYVDYRTAATARISEIRPSSSASSRPSSIEVVATGSDGKKRRYQEVRRRSSKRSSGSSSKIALDASASSRRHGRTPPRAPSPPPMMSIDASVQEQYEEVKRVLSPDGTAIYDHPPSLEMYQAEGIDDRRSSARRSSFSSISAEVDEPAEPRRSALRKGRLSDIVVDSGASMTSRTSSSGGSAPGLGNLPRFLHSRVDSANELPLRQSERKETVNSDSGVDSDEVMYRKASVEDEQQSDIESDRLSPSNLQYRQSIEDEQAQKERSRLAESSRRQQQAIDEDQAEKERMRLFASSQRQQKAIDEDQAEKERARLAASQRRFYQAQDDEQARILRESTAATETRQRVRAAREAEAAAQRHAEDLDREEQRRERHRRQAASALERSEVDSATQRDIDAEFDRLAQEKEEDDAIRRAIEESQQKARHVKQGSISSTISAREYTPSRSSYVPSSIRYPSGVAVHNYTPSSGTSSTIGSSTQREEAEATAGENRRRRRQEKDSIDVAMEEMEARMRSAFGRIESARDEDRRRRRAQLHEEKQFYR